MIVPKDTPLDALGFNPGFDELMTNFNNLVPSLKVMLVMSVCYSHLGTFVIMGEVAMVTGVFFSSLLSDFSLTTFSINSLQLFLSFAVVLHSPPTLSRSLLKQSSHRTLGLPRILFPSTFWASHLFASCSTHILST